MEELAEWLKRRRRFGKNSWGWTMCQTGKDRKNPCLTNNGLRKPDRGRGRDQKKQDITWREGTNMPGNWGSGRA